VVPVAAEADPAGPVTDAELPAGLHEIAGEVFAVVVGELEPAAVWTIATTNASTSFIPCSESVQ
jgi:hypothetical protein